MIVCATARNLATVLVVASLAVGCGKTTSDAAGRDGGASSVVGGTMGVGGRTTGAAGSGGNPAGCPLETPTDGDSCDLAEPCEYGVIDKGCCVEVTTAHCIDSIWDVRELDCDCPTDGTGGASVIGNSCHANDDCLLTLRDCCAPCDMNTADDYVALNRAAYATYEATRCAGGDGCPPCVALGTQSVTATCNAGHCEVVDLSTDPITKCTTDDDCLLRTRECCECGADVQSLAVINPNEHGAFQALVCGPDTGCDGCLPTLPDWQTPVCAGGVCAIYYY